MDTSYRETTSVGHRLLPVLSMSFLPYDRRLLSHLDIDPGRQIFGNGGGGKIRIGNDSGKIGGAADRKYGSGFEFQVVGEQPGAVGVFDYLT